MYNRTRKSDIVIDGPLELKTGQEWYSKPFDTPIDSIVRIRSIGTQRFYVGIYAEEVFQTLHKRNPTSFPFDFGSDRKELEDVYIVRIDGPHRVVVRLGSFNSPGKTDLQVEVIGPPT